MKRIVLIDDDPLFGNIMVRFAKGKGVDIDYFESLLDYESFGRTIKYDAAIVDYDLGNMTGIDIAEQLQILFGDIPLVLVSSQDKGRLFNKTWPNTIKAFVPKQAGYEAIFSELQSCISDLDPLPQHQREPMIALTTKGSH